MQIFLEDFSCYLEQLFCREPISACFWRKELHHGRYFRSFKNKEGGSLQVCQFLIRKRWKLNTVNLQLLLKGDFSKFLGKALFGTYHDARVRFFSAVLQNVKSFLSLLKCDSTKDAFPGILKFLRTNKGNTCGRISFRHSYRWLDWTAWIFKRNPIKDVFVLIIFQNLDNSNFLNVLSKMCEEVFLEAFS